jgi:2-keto-3-deoxy-L-rhamnonate aldolase
VSSRILSTYVSRKGWLTSLRSHGDVSTHVQVSLDPRIDHSTFRVYSGFGQQLGPIVLFGAAGAIDGLASFYPKTVVRLMALSEKRPVDKATLEEVQRLQYAVSRAEVFIEKTGIIGIREGIFRVAGMGGVEGGRLPLSGRLREDIWKTLHASLLTGIEEIESKLP